MSWDPFGLADAIGESFSEFFTDIDEVINMARVLPNGETGIIEGGKPVMYETFPANQLWNTANTISKTCVAPVAATFLGIFLAIEIFHVAQRTKVDSGLDLFYQILMSVLKMSICLFFIENMSVIILSCFQIASVIVKSISSFNTTIHVDLDSVQEGVKEHFKNNDSMLDWSLLGTYLIVLIAKLVFRLNDILNNFLVVNPPCTISWFRVLFCQ